MKDFDDMNMAELRRMYEAMDNILKYVENRAEEAFAEFIAEDTDINRDSLLIAREYSRKVRSCINNI